MVNLGGVYAAMSAPAEENKAIGSHANEQYSRAEALLSKAQELDPTSDKALYFLGSLYQRWGEGRALSFLQRAVDMDPLNRVAWYMLGNAYYDLGERGAAVAAWRHVPYLELRHVLLGNNQVKAQKWDLALTEYQLAVEIAPNSPEAKQGLGHALVYGFGKYDEGIAAYYQSITLGNPDGYVWMKIAHAMDMSGRLEDAVRLLDERGMKGYLADAIRGKAYLQRGMVDESIQSYLASAAAQPADPWIWFGLGNAYVAGSQPDKAIEVWKRALNISPGFTPAMGALQGIGAK